MVKRVLLEETAPRDGLQNEPVRFSVEDRVHLVEALADCGFRRIQVGSMVHPRAVPQMADTEEVVRRLRSREGVIFSVLVLNSKGLRRALECGVTHVATFVSASETHSRKNSGCSVKEGLKRACAVIGEARKHGVSVQAGVMNAFGCHFEGPIPEERVFALLAELEMAGAQELTLADTSGLAHPLQIERMMSEVLDKFSLPVGLHLHDTWGFGLANVYAAWKVGVERFDVACGGLGGCPFIPNASGNVAAEDVVHLFHSMGVDTGVHLGKVVEVTRFLEEKLGRPLPARYSKLCNPALSQKRTS